MSKSINKATKSALLNRHISKLEIEYDVKEWTVVPCSAVSKTACISLNNGHKYHISYTGGLTYRQLFQAAQADHRKSVFKELILLQRDLPVFSSYSSYDGMDYLYSSCHLKSFNGLAIHERMGGFTIVELTTDDRGRFDTFKEVLSLT